MASGDPSNYFVHTLLRARDWQHRPQLDEVCAWWRGGGHGVCGLIGMGGAGKTAIAERFLRSLPDVLPVDDACPKDRSLPTPNSTFVFSFYDAPNPEAFFAELHTWLTGSPNVTAQVSFHGLIYLMQSAVPGLMILDGLEKVQDDGRRGVLGRIDNPNLRDFVGRLSEGYFPKISALITSRLRLADLDEESSALFSAIPIDQIEIPTGLQLLRARGVHGADPQLKKIVKDCGQHALTVDFAGGYIAEYGGGDPNTSLKFDSAGELQQRAKKEQDDAKRKVLKQGFRFARVAEQYREKMLANDPAAIALLERICLFRPGVAAQTLTAIFTGKKAIKASGKALAALDADQLQEKLDWLVRMRIVEKAERGETKEEGGRRKNPIPPSSFLLPPSSLYTIHPAVRDGFFSGIGQADRQASHEAVRQGLEVSLGDAPGANPSDPATLDLLEEIVHHTLQSNHVQEAWDIYWNRIGAYQNLIWRLGAYERGERICRAFAGGQSPESIRPLSLEGEGQGEGEPGAEQATNPPYLALPENQPAVFINEWALYLTHLGRLAAAAGCYELYLKSSLRREDWKNASIGNQNLCEVLVLSGRLARSAGKGGLSIATEALRLAERSDDAVLRWDSHAHVAHARTLRGEVTAALADFGAALDWQKKAFPTYSEGSLGSVPGIWAGHLLARLGRREEATRLTEANSEFLTKGFGAEHQHIPQCNLVLSDLPGESLDRSSRESLCRSARDWASQRDAKEVLCWSALVQARLELAKAHQPDAQAREGSPNDCAPSLAKPHQPDAQAREGSPNDRDPSLARRASETAITEGLKIARDCGYGLYHIDLLLEAARLHLLRGKPQSALDDLRLALDDGIPANDQTGQPELLAANHEACGYAWAIPAGLHLRAEAQLLQAAQLIGEATYKPRSRKTPAEARELIKQAKSNLRKAMTRWKKLHDPEPERPDQNFQLDGKQYNYRAEETYRVIEQLNLGVLTEYPLITITHDVPEKGNEDMSDDSYSPSSHLTKARNWLQARFAEESRQREIVQVHTGEGGREATDDERLRARVQQREFHDYLLSIDAPIRETTRECARLGWISTIQRHRVVGNSTVPTGPRYYEISGTVTELTGNAGEASKRFAVALSFPGAKREFVEAVADHLAKEVGRERVLYDKWYEAEFARPRLATYLPRLYHDKSELIAVFLCAEYQNQEWCGLEWDAILDLIKQREEDAVMLLRFDDTEIAGLYSTHGYAWIEDRPAAEIAELILTRWRQAVGKPAERKPNTAPDSSSAAAPPELDGGALGIWREKLAYYRQQEAISADPAQKFALNKQIEEVEQKIRELGG